MAEQQARERWGLDKAPEPIACPACGRLFVPRKIGAHRRKFCSPACKHTFETAARAYATAMVDAGLLTFDSMQAAISARTATKDSGRGQPRVKGNTPAISSRATEKGQ